MAGVATDAPTIMSIKEAHDKLGHRHEESIRATAKALGIQLKTGTLGVCEACATAKAKQKNVLKESKAGELGEGERRIFLDISTIREPKGMTVLGKPNWRIMVDQRGNYKHSGFYATKSGMVEPTCVQLSKWEKEGNPVTIIRMDNAGENKKLAERIHSSDWKIKIKI